MIRFFDLRLFGFGCITILIGWACRFFIFPLSTSRSSIKVFFFNSVWSSWFRSFKPKNQNQGWTSFQRDKDQLTSQQFLRNVIHLHVLWNNRYHWSVGARPCATITFLDRSRSLSILFWHLWKVLRFDRAYSALKYFQFSSLLSHLPYMIMISKKGTYSIRFLISILGDWFYIDFLTNFFLIIPTKIFTTSDYLKIGRFSFLKKNSSYDTQ